jgi:hypothetical protein
MPRRAAVLAVFLHAACTSTDSGDEGTGSSETTGVANLDPHVDFTASVDVASLCATQDTGTVSLRAIKVGCATAAPCTIPINPFEMFIDETSTCPPSQPSLMLTVTVPDAARYQVEARADNGDTGVCYGLAGDTKLIVTAEDLEARRTVALTPTGAPCPAP